jgi:EpsD family peptidyl-prolyl cis-trans isomerase
MARPGPSNWIVIRQDFLWEFKVTMADAGSIKISQRMKTPARLGRLAVIFACCGVLLGGCGKGEQANTTRGQVVARIGNEVVTNQELENELRWSNVPADKQKDPEVIKRVLGELVVRKYLLQQALSEKLDREPSVLLDMIRSREQVLQNAVLTRNAVSKSPEKADIDKYIANNASKFSERKIFGVEQIVFPFGPASQSFVDANRSAKTLDEVDQQLTSARIPHGRQTGTLVSSDIPQDLYDSIEAEGEAKVFFVRNAGNGVFFVVRDQQPRPIEGEAAANVARQLMRADALKAELSLASYTANAEARYEGDYARVMQGNGSKD